MEKAAWSNRLRERSDMVTRVAHLTRGEDDEKAFENLCSILTSKKLVASNAKGVNVNGAKVCCFQEIPLLSIAENLRVEKEIKGNRYSPFGLRFLKIDLFRSGGRPVIYGDSEKLKRFIPLDEQWRIVKMDLSDQDQIVDWSHEREWRIDKDYPFEYSDMEIIVSTPLYYRKLVQWCMENSHVDILNQTNGIVVLNSICN